MSAKPLLVELFTEELPPKALAKLGNAFASGVEQGLKKLGLLESNAVATMFASPRRLAVSVSNVRKVGPDEAVARKVMPVSVGLDVDGNATPALIKKLASLGRANFDVSKLAREGEGKAAQLVLNDIAKGQSLQVALQSALEEAIAGLPVPKVMSYQLADGETTVQFVRPAHGLVAMHGSEIVPVHVLGLDAGRVTHGHRFQGENNIELAHADEYERRLRKEGNVIASFDARRIEIKALLEQSAMEADATFGLSLGPEADYVALLDEVTGLVEFPTVYVGQFEQEFLEVPKECLILTMKLNQKYFPLFLSMGGLSNRFLIVSNMRLDDPRNVIEGNQRVVRPRLADARFFFDKDKRTKLADHIPKLASVVYHNRLGSQGERVEHVRAIAKAIAALTSNDLAFSDQVDDAAHLAKADLVTDMVGEFPELQGTMGKYYALNEGLSPDVANAIEDHYKPRFAGDTLPRNNVGVIVALADKFATLAGMFSIGERPTGDKDPFALRRHAIGAVRILVEKALPIDVSTLVNVVVKQFGPTIFAQGVMPTVTPHNSAISASGVRVLPDTAAKLIEFIFERFAVMQKDQGYTSLEVEAVLSLKPERLSNVPDYLKAVRAFSLLPEAKSLAAANKRINNILKKSVGVIATYSRSKMHEQAELSLAAVAEEVIPVAMKLFEFDLYEKSLCEFAKLREPLDIFFDQVMVNADDPEIRANRLGLLATLHREMNRIADLSKLAA